MGNLSQNSLQKTSKAIPLRSHSRLQLWTLTRASLSLDYIGSNVRSRGPWLARRPAQGPPNAQSRALLPFFANWIQLDLSSWLTTCSPGSVEFRLRTCWTLVVAAPFETT